MSDKGEEKLSLKHSNATKRLFKETDLPNDDNDFINASVVHDCSQSNSSFSSKRFKYRDQNLESLDGDTLKTALESPGLTDSIDSSSWNNASFSFQSASKSASLASLELNSIIQRYDDATLNSLSMSQMSGLSEDAVCSPFPQTLDMASQSSSKDESMASIELSSLASHSQQSTFTSFSMSQSSVMSYSENAMTSPIPQAEELTSSQTSPVANLDKSFGSSSQEIMPSGLFGTHLPNEISSSSSYCEVSQHNLTKLTCLSDPILAHNIEPKNDLNERPITSVGSLDTKPCSKKCLAGDNLKTKQTNANKDQKSVQSCKREDIKETNSDNGEEEVEDENEDEKEDKEVGDSGKKKRCPGLNTSLHQENNSELKENFKSCKKNPGHEKFFSPLELKVSNLPPDIQHEDSVTLFQCLSKLVIHISVSSTSDNRSADDTYSSYIGTSKVRNGSGFIASTDANIMKIKCTRKDCPHNVKEDESPSTSKPSTSEFDRSISNMSTSSSVSSSSIDSNSSVKKHLVFGGVYIRTNKHVIFDKSEADNACVNFFYHSSDKKEVVKGYVSSIHGVNDEQDHIILHVMSHDRHLLNVVDLQLKNAKSSYVQMIKSTYNTQHYLGRNKKCWVAVISHPHGTPSAISFGRLRKEEASTHRVIKYYDASTCPGSSGGLVITPTLLQLQWPGAVHSSFCHKTKFNVSLDSRFQELDTSVIGQMYKNVLNRKDSAPENQYRL